MAKSRRGGRRRWNPNVKKRVLRKQGNMCALCKEMLPYEKAEGHHIIPKSKGGTKSEENCMMLCTPCHNFIHDIKRRK